VERCSEKSLVSFHEINGQTERERFECEFVRLDMCGRSSYEERELKV